MLRLLSACCPCLRPAEAGTEDDNTVIPNETSRLIPAPPGLVAYSAGERGALAVDTQKLNERLGTIVRAKEGKMVNVSARAPFVMHRAPSVSSASAPPSPTAPGVEVASAPAPRTSRRPPVLTMTPARASLYAESRYSSPSGSRSSSRRRPDTTYAYGVRAKQASAASGSEWFGESAPESEMDVEESAVAPSDSAAAAPEEVIVPAAPLPIAAVRAEGEGARGKAEARGFGIAFSWSDT
ncbi:hypothetical protein FB451DRAFT_354427 [Mycena latifolia]|nr:hypothetical protein FB451DRAFT_354427 [Mycena latifolia]